MCRMAMVESAATFAARCHAFGIPDQHIHLLSVVNLDTFAAFAFVVPYSPNGPDDTKLITFVTELIAAAPSTILLARYRRLQFEAYTLMLADTKNRIERTDDAPVRRLPQPERSARLAAQKLRITGIEFGLDTEPSHQLQDLVQQVCEENTLRYISLDMCTSRGQELNGVKKTAQSVVTAKDGALKVSTSDEQQEADISTDWRIRMALQRRALAFDQSSLVDFVTMEVWTNKLFAAMSRPPLEGYARVSLAQVLSADKELFCLIAERCIDGINPLPSGARPFSDAFKLMQRDERVVFLLLPLAGHSGSGSRKYKALGDDEEQSSSRRQRKRQRIASTPVNSKGGKGGKGLGPPKLGKGPQKGKGKGKFDSAYLMPGLEGCWTRMGRDILCQKLNLGQCPESSVAGGDWCSRGLHMCCTPGCKQKHPRTSCPSK